MSVRSSELGPPSPADECVPKEGGTHSSGGEGVGGSQFGRREKKPSTLSTLWVMAIDKGRVGSREKQVVISAHVGEGGGGVSVYRAVRKLLFIPPSL